MWSRNFGWLPLITDYSYPRLHKATIYTAALVQQAFKKEQTYTQKSANKIWFSAANRSVYNDYLTTKQLQYIESSQYDNVFACAEYIVWQLPHYYTLSVCLHFNDVKLGLTCGYLTNLKPLNINNLALLS